MKRIWAIALCVIGLSLSSCTEASQGPISTSTAPGLSVITGMQSDGAATTSVAVMTDAAGLPVTDNSGHPVTSIVTVQPTSPPISSETERQVVTDVGSEVMTSSVYPTTIPSKATDSNTPSRLSDTTISRTTEMITTHPPESSITLQTTTTATALSPADPWRFPYVLSPLYPDCPNIYDDCRKEIERLGMVWKEELRPDNSAWANPESTIPNTYFPADCYLRDDVFEMIHFYHKINTRRYCRIWFEPHPDSPGDYLFYFLEEY